eukprot:TRINITY_DN7375_c0_g1_i1.p1 TRINITY_DN7375_c0_g1~~TRINITY_DN7375_c0_g1_i1.p1  ORF type:complete len:289 (+),score=50.60 TRINITY_DN7375_c0_g1_i1:59-925(+)
MWELMETIKNATLPFIHLSSPFTLPLYFLMPENLLGNLSFAFLLSKVLGLLVMFLCAMMKIPQIFALIRSRSPKGFPIQPLLLENFAFSIHISFNLRAGLSLTVWGECLFLFIENSILLFLFHVYSKNLHVFFVHHSIFLSFPLLISATLPLYLHEWLMLLTIPLFLISSAMQLKNNQRNQHIGQLSPESLYMGLVCSLCRLYTTIMEVPKPHFILISFINVLVAISFVLQMLFFKENTRRFLNEISAKETPTTPEKEPKKSANKAEAEGNIIREKALLGNRREAKAE